MENAQVNMTRILNTLWTTDEMLLLVGFEKMSLDYKYMYKFLPNLQNQHLWQQLFPVEQALHSEHWSWFLFDMRLYFGRWVC